MMKTILSNYLVALAVYVVSVLAAMLVFVAPAPASAAAEGCYRRTFSAERLTFTNIDCPPGTNAIVFDDPSTLKCFITDKSGSDLTSADFEPLDCGEFTEGTTNTSTSSVPSSSSNATGIADAVEADCTADSLNADNCQIISYIVVVINVLSAIAGMAIIASVMIAGYQYMTARDNSGQIMKAKLRIVWALVALALFIFMYSLLNFLVPGGVL